MSAVLLLLLAAEPSVQAEAPVRGTELSASLGLRSSSYGYFGGRTGVAAGVLAADGRYTFKLLAVEATVVGTVPLQGNLSAADLAGALRVGVTHPRFSVTLGVIATFTDSTPLAKVQVLPSLAAAAKFGDFVVSLGLFDRLATAPARLSLEWRFIGAGWVFPLGGEVFGRIPLVPHLQLEARVLAFSLFSSLQILGVVGVVLS